MKPTTKAVLRTTVVITLDIAGDPETSLAVVQRALDSGALQDEINDYEMPGPRLRVLSATADLPEDRRPQATDSWRDHKPEGGR